MLRLVVKKYLYFWLLITLLLFTTFNIHNLNFNFIFKVEKVDFNSTKFIDEITKSNSIDLILKKNIFLINKSEINKIFHENSWVKNVEIKKKFPKTVLLNIEEYHPIAYYENNKRIYIINDGFRSLINTDKINLLSLIRLKNIKDLKQFEQFYKLINKKFSFFSEIEELNHMYGNRWDIILKNQKVIKLGNYALEEQIINSNLYLEDNSIKILDFRIRGRVFTSYD